MMSMELRIKTYRPFTDLVVGLSGELDLATRHLVSESLDAFHARRFAHTTIDCADLSFCDCAGLDALIAAHHALSNPDGAFRLTHVDPRLVRLIDLTHCGWLLEQLPVDLSR